MRIKCFSIFGSWTFWLIGGLFAVFLLFIDPKSSMVESVVSITTSYIAMLIIGFMGWLMYWPNMKDEKE